MMPRINLAIIVCLFSVGANYCTAEQALPSLNETIKAVRPFGFTEPPEQIPATVVGNGILAFVPYSSFKIGADRELNVYGDPDNPACVEIGIYRSLLNSQSEMEKCVGFLQRLIPGIDLRGIRFTGGKVMKGGWVAEVTPSTAPDAYGGWWVSVYSLNQLHAAKGTRANVNVVSVPIEGVPSDSGWTATDMGYARPSLGGGESTNRVYVKSYTRKDGTYVSGHTRSKSNSK